MDAHRANLEKRFKTFPKSEMDRLLQGLSDVLSTVDIGEGAAFDFLAETESVAISVYKDAKKHVSFDMCLYCVQDFANGSSGAIHFEYFTLESFLSVMRFAAAYCLMTGDKLHWEDTGEMIFLAKGEPFDVSEHHCPGCRQQKRNA